MSSQGHDDATTHTAQVEIDEKPYRQHQSHPLVEVTVWYSLERSKTLWFEKTDPARETLEPVGALLGDVPRLMADALEDAGYQIRT